MYVCGVVLPKLLLQVPGFAVEKRKYA